MKDWLLISEFSMSISLVLVIISISMVETECQSDPPVAVCVLNVISDAAFGIY